MQRQWRRLSCFFLTRALLTAACVGIFVLSAFVTLELQADRLYASITAGEMQVSDVRGFRRQWSARCYPHPFGLRWALQCGFAHRDSHTTIRVPFVLVIVALGTWTAFIWRNRKAIPPGLCCRCRYDLTGNESGVCPECGASIPGGRQKTCGGGADLN